MKVQLLPIGYDATAGGANLSEPIVEDVQQSGRAATLFGEAADRYGA
jgi:hypothetical protein